MLYILLLIFCLKIDASVFPFENRFEKFKSDRVGKLKLSGLLAQTEMDSLLRVLSERGQSRSLESQFLRWIDDLPSFEPVWQSVGYYAKPKSQEGFDRRNKKNAGAVVSLSNLSLQIEFFRKHETLFSRLEENYGVKAEILVALCSMETRLNQAHLPHFAYAVFATQLAFLRDVFQLRSDGLDLKRVERLMRMARHNLVSLFLYTSENRISVEEIRSSWAGACGPMQFLPFNFHYLEDGDLDGDIDLRKVDDALAGAANFLMKKGWTRKHNDWFESGGTDHELLAVLKRYNANDEYAAGVLRSARLLRSELNVSKTKEKIIQ